MHKSSSETYIHKYIYPFVKIVVCLIAIYLLNQSKDKFTSGLFSAPSFVIFWMFVGICQLPFRLKSIEADSDGIWILSSESRKRVKYKNIEYISKFDFAAPSFITIKYKEEGTNLSKKIAYVPKSKNFLSFQDDDLTTYMKSKLKLHKPHFDESTQPSAVKNFLILVLLSILYFGVVFYFFEIR